jgi:hypothetical protein
MDFLTFYPKGKNLFIEFIPDKYINWQPNTENDIKSKIEDIVPIINELRDYCRTRGISQVIVIDCDKAIQFDRLNYVLACKMVTVLTRDYPDPSEVLKRVEVKHCNQAITTIYNSSKILLPKKVVDIFHLYSK